MNKRRHGIALAEDKILNRPKYCTEKSKLKLILKFEPLGYTDTVEIWLLEVSILLFLQIY